MKFNRQKVYKWIKIGGNNYQFDQSINAVFYGNEWRFVEAAADGSLYVLLKGNRHYFDAEPHTYSKVVIEFEDKGQDFLAWEIDYNTGELIQCKEKEQCVASKWVGLYVDEPHTLKVGGTVNVTIKKRPICPKSKMITVKYRLTKVTKIK